MDLTSLEDRSSAVIISSPGLLMYYFFLECFEKKCGKKAWKMLRVRSQGLNRGFCGYTSNVSLAHTSISSELGLSASISVIPNSGV